MKIKALQPPLLWPSFGMTDAEAEAVKDLYANLYGVSYNVAAWESSLRLYEFAKSPPDSVSPAFARGWKFIAAHECVMQLYYLGERLQVIRGHKVRPCPTIKSFVDNAEIRKAIKALADYFPDIEALRHAIAHQGSIGTNPAKHAPDGLFGLVGFRASDRFSAPYEGVDRHLDLTPETLDKIKLVAAQFLGAFLPAARELERIGHVPE